MPSTQTLTSQQERLRRNLRTERKRAEMMISYLDLKIGDEIPIEATNQTEMTSCGGIKYLLYATAKHEFEVAEAIRELGLWVAAPKSLERKRIGRTKRDVKFYDAPYVPNFLFAEIPADRFLDVVAVKHVAPTLTPVPRGEWEGGTDARGNIREGVAHFLDAVESEYQARYKERENLNAPVWEFEPGQALEVLSGPFMGFMARFRKMVEQAYHPFPKVGAEVDVFGRTTPIELDPLDVRRA